MRKLFITIYTMVACLHLAPALAAGADAQTVEHAFLDQVLVDSAAHTVRLTGWAVSRSGKAGNPTLGVEIDGRVIYTGPGQVQARPDVVKQTGHPQWLASGWTVSVPLAGVASPGTRSLLVAVRFDDEAPIASRPSAPENATINVPVERPRIRVRAALLAAALLPLLGFVFSQPLSRLCAKTMGRTVSQVVPPALGLVLSFATAVTLGLSGSSLSEAQAPLPIAGLNTTVIANSAQNIRSDEWFVLSTMAIGQVRHSPSFPVVNTNLGPNGQNMLVVGMTAVPVLRLSALARPATWGYFFLPLPQALAWHWWLPIFGCVLGLWACFCVLFPGNWRTCLVLSACFVASPYVVAWSYWPAYVTMFAAAAFAGVVQLLKAHRGWTMPLLALLIGISAAGFVLTLYPAWQVPLGYLFLFLLAAILYRDRREFGLSAANLMWVAVGLLVAAVAVLSWWLDAHEAIAAMVATIYPGQRSAELGGGIDRWYLARGITNFVTLYSDLGGVSNASEVSSFIYLTLPALVGALLNRTHIGRGKPVFYALVAFLIFASLYQFIGFPLWLAKLSLWGRTFASRVDIAVGLASIALLGCALASHGEIDDRDTARVRMQAVIAATTAIIWTAVVWGSFRLAPEPITKLVERPTLVVLLCVVGAWSYLLATRWTRTFLASYLLVLIFTTSAFNPLTLMSSAVRPASLKGNHGECPIGGGRTLVLGLNVPAMTLMASGCPILDGVSFYPQMALWQGVDPTGQQAAIYNRYQRLQFYLADMGGSRQAKITAPQLDTVRVDFDSRAFNFARLPISNVLIEAGSVHDLPLNPSLRKIVSPLYGFDMFKVVR